jgi:tartrate dehydratase alpha subunit/fumarate hydratase class I-like protein
MLDVRVFELPPNVSLAAVRAFGVEDVRQTLKLQKASEASAVDALQKSAFIQAIIDPAYSRNPYSRDTELQASQEYRRVQVKAGSDDKKLNKALALGVAAALTAAGVTATVVAEKQANEGSLKPDIRISLADGRLFCLEPTWRSTGEAIAGEIKERQNTLTVGHIRKYLLEKVLGYVNDLNL